MNRGQGSLEYLIIIAAVLAIAAVVVLYLSGVLPDKAQSYDPYEVMCEIDESVIESGFKYYSTTDEGKNQYTNMALEFMGGRCSNYWKVRLFNFLVENNYTLYYCTEKMVYGCE